MYNNAPLIILLCKIQKVALFLLSLNVGYCSSCFLFSKSIFISYRSSLGCFVHQLVYVVFQHVFIHQLVSVVFSMFFVQQKVCSLVIVHQFYFIIRLFCSSVSVSCFSTCFCWSVSFCCFSTCFLFSKKYVNQLPFISFYSLLGYLVHHLVLVVFQHAFVHQLVSICSSVSVGCFQQVFVHQLLFLFTSYTFIHY